MNISTDQIRETVEDCTAIILKGRGKPARATLCDVIFNQIDSLRKLYPLSRDLFVDLSCDEDALLEMVNRLSDRIR